MAGVALCSIGDQATDATFFARSGADFAAGAALKGAERTQRSICKVWCKFRCRRSTFARSRYRRSMFVAGAPPLEDTNQRIDEQSDR